MRFTRARVILAAGVLAGAGTLTGTVLAAGPAAAGSSPVVMVNCAGQGQVRPSGYDIGCMRTNCWPSCTGTEGGRSPSAAGY